MCQEQRQETWYERNDRLRSELKARARKLFVDLNQILIDSEEVGSMVGRDVWAILTALRGPDFPAGFDVKFQSTAVIRHLVVPNQRYGDSNGSRDDIADLLSAPKRAINPASRTGHFEEHIDTAVAAIKRMGFDSVPTPYVNEDDDPDKPKPYVFNGIDVDDDAA